MSISCDELPVAIEEHYKALYIFYGFWGLPFHNCHCFRWCPLDFHFRDHIAQESNLLFFEDPFSMSAARPFSINEYITLMISKRPLVPFLEWMMKMSSISINTFLSRNSFSIQFSSHDIMKARAILLCKTIKRFHLHRVLDDVVVVVHMLHLRDSF